MHRLSLDCFLLAASTKQRAMLVIVTYEAKMILSATTVPIGESNPNVLTNRLNQPYSLLLYITSYKTKYTY